MRFQIGLEIRIGRSFTSFSINLQLALFYAYPMVGHEADDGITPQVVGERRIEVYGFSLIGKVGDELAGRIGIGGLADERLSHDSHLLSPGWIRPSGKTL